MSFFAGFVEGITGSVDKALQRSIKRTQDYNQEILENRLALFSRLYLHQRFYLRFCKRKFHLKNRSLLMIRAAG